MNPISSTQCGISDSHTYTCIVRPRTPAHRERERHPCRTLSMQILLGLERTHVVEGGHLSFSLPRSLYAGHFVSRSASAPTHNTTYKTGNKKQGSQANSVSITWEDAQPDTAESKWVDRRSRCCTQCGLHDCGKVTARDAAQLAKLPGLRRRAASATMYAVANVSPAPFVSTASTWYDMSFPCDHHCTCL